MEANTPLLVQTEFSHLARDAVRPGYMRLTMEGRLFYAHADQFAASDLFDALQPGDRVLAGVHSLEEPGTFWLHWLHVPGKGDTVERGIGKSIVMPTVLGVLVVVLCCIGLFSDGAAFWLFFLAAPVVVLLLLFSILTPLPLSRLLARRTERRRFLELGLERIRMGLSDPNSVTKAKDLPLPVDHRVEKEYFGELAQFLDTVQGAVADVTGKKYHQRRRGSYYTYCFDCGGDNLFWVVENPKNTWEYKAPEFITKRPEFLAEGDRVTAVVPNRLSWRPSNEFQSIPQPGRREAAVLVNHSDARLSVPVYRRQGLIPVRIIAAIAFLVAFFLVVTSLSSIFSQSPVSPSNSSRIIWGVILYGATAFVLGIFECMYGWETVFLGGDAYPQRLDSAIASTTGFTREPEWQWRHSRRKAIAWFLFLGISVAGSIAGVFYMMPYL